MFKTEYIYELTSGQLSNEGYKHILNVISLFIKKYKWPKSIVVSNENITTQFWSVDEIKELTHQFFEWALSKGKFDHLSKIPEQYLSYYFAQILVSFVADRIKEEQQKEGLSYKKCKELVISICKEDYIINSIQGKDYVFIQAFSVNDIRPFEEIQNTLNYLSKIPIKESTKHFRPLVKMAIEDIFNVIETPVSLEKLLETAFSIFDQKSFNKLEATHEFLTEEEPYNTSSKYNQTIQQLLFGVTKDDAKMLSHFLFNNKEAQSLTEIAAMYNIPKSTLHYKIDIFKKRISSSYTPENEQDGIFFIQNIAKALDKLSK